MVFSAAISLQRKWRLNLPRIGVLGLHDLGQALTAPTGSTPPAHQRHNPDGSFQNGLTGAR